MIKYLCKSPRVLIAEQTELKTDIHANRIELKQFNFFNQKNQPTMNFSARNNIHNLYDYQGNEHQCEI